MKWAIYLKPEQGRHHSLGKGSRRPLLKKKKKEGAVSELEYSYLQTEDSKQDFSTSLRKLLPKGNQGMATLWEETITYHPAKHSKEHSP